MDFSVEEVVKKRYSVRTYDKRPVEAEVKEQLLAYAEQLENPLGPKIKVQWIEKELAANGDKLGTYGVIKGAKSYLGVTVPKEEYAPEAVGYDFEQLVLYAASLGLGTCWLGGTFNRSAFALTMDIAEGEVFPILSPVGYPAQKRSLTEQVMRKSIKADKRFEWKELFFKDNLDHPLSEEEAGEYKFPLEMVQLAPSAANKQPWRVVVSDNAIHFFEKHSLGAEGGSMDMQRIDVGIAICHFHLALLEAGKTGHFERKAPDFAVPSDMSYIVTWLPD